MLKFSTFILCNTSVIKGNSGVSMLSVVNPFRGYNLIMQDGHFLCFIKTKEIFIHAYL